MAVIYLFDAQKQPQGPVRDVEEIIHSEGEYSAVAMIRTNQQPEYGGYFGFRCADGRFRLFLISIRETSDETGICTLTGTDAALAELDGEVLTRLTLQNKTAQRAVTEALSGTGWTIGKAEADGEVNTEDVYFATVWTALKTIGTAGRVRIVPYYEFSGNRITGRKVDVLSREPVWSGLIYTRKKGAQNIFITEEGVPKGRVYGIGKIIGDSEPPEQLTFADVVWSTANGDPADKPAGQEWVALQGARSTAAYVFEDKKETDPNKLIEKAFEDLQKTQQPKASGTANLSEMEHMPGYEHLAVRMWMQIAVRTESGQTVKATITNIERYHVHRKLTKITIGEESEEDTLESQLAKMNALLADTARVAGGGSAGAGKAKVMVLEAEELIQLNSERIELNAKEISLRAFEADVVQFKDETEVLFKEVYVDIDTNRAEIGATNTIVDNLGNEVSTMSATLTIQAEQIAARVEKDGVISSINQTAEEIKIQASKINLEGYVTASELDAAVADITLAFANTVATDTLEANSAIIGYMTYQDEYCTWKSKTVQTSIPEFTKATVTLANGNSISVVTGWATAPSSLRSTLTYLGQA